LGSKKTTTSKTVNSLPDWLTSPYQAATAQASALSQRPAISSGTQTVLDRTMADSATGSALATTGSNLMTQFANGNFGANADALTGAANGDFLASNPFAQNGRPTAVSSALNGFAQDGGLDAGYINDSLLNKTAAGDFLTAGSNPYIKGVADQGADAAMARINAQFGASGRSNGSGLYAQLFGQGISDAANSVYAQNYANERQLQQAAQNTLLGANQSSRENALARQYGASGSIFGAENASAENAAQRQASAYDAERQRQQAAAGGLLNTQLSASSQIPSLISSMISSNQAGLSAGSYQDNAEMERLRQRTAILSALAAPYAITDSKTKEKSGGLGSVIGSIAQAAGAIAAPFTGGASLLGSAGAAAGPIMGGGFSGALSGMATGALPSWLGA